MIHSPNKLHIHATYLPNAKKHTDALTHTQVDHIPKNTLPQLLVHAAHAGNNGDGF